MRMTACNGSEPGAEYRRASAENRYQYDHKLSVLQIDSKFLKKHTAYEMIRKEKLNNMKKYFIATMGADFRKYVMDRDVGIELDFFCMAENLEGSRYDAVSREIRKLMDSCNISGEDMVLHAPFNELHPAAIDPGALELARRRMEQSYHVCEEFGIKKMVVHSGYMPHVYFKSWHNERSVEFWTEFMSSKPEDFKLCIENVLEDEPYMMRDMLEAVRKDGGSGNIGICLDIGHANCISGVDAAQWIETLHPYINHFHIHNNDGQHDLHKPFEDGTMDVKALLDKAQQLCAPETTYTIEVMDCGDAVEWLTKGGWIKKKS